MGKSQYEENYDELCYMFPRDDIGIKKMKKKSEIRCVAFIDILGFKNMVEDDLDNAIDVVTTLKKANDIFTRNFNSIFKNNNTSVRDNNLISTSFSDCIIISCSLGNAEFSFSKIESMIKTLAEIQFCVMKKGYFIRGGVTIGECYHDEHFVFGKAVNEAYFLECNSAIYPRVIISDELNEFINNCVESDLLYHLNNIHGEEKKISIEYDIENESELANYLERFKSTYINESDIPFIDYINACMDFYCPADYFITYMNDFESDILNPTIFGIKKGLLEKDENIKKKYIWMAKYLNNNVKKYKLDEQKFKIRYDK